MLFLKKIFPFLILIHTFNAESQTLESSNGEYVKDAFIVDYKDDKPIYFCQAKHSDASFHIGRVQIGSGCHYGYGGREYIAKNYLVHEDSEEENMISIRNTERVNPGFVTRSKNVHDVQLPCALEISGSWQAGKYLFNSGCHVGINNKEISVTEFVHIRFLNSDDCGDEGEGVETYGIGPFTRINDVQSQNSNEASEDLVNIQRKKAIELLSLFEKNLPTPIASVFEFNVNKTVLSFYREKFGDMRLITEIIETDFESDNLLALSKELLQAVDNFKKNLLNSLKLTDEAENYLTKIELDKINTLSKEVASLRSERRINNKLFHDSIAILGVTKGPRAFGVAGSFRGRPLKESTIEENFRASEELFNKWQNHVKKRITSEQTLLQAIISTETNIQNYNEAVRTLSQMEEHHESTLSYLENYSLLLSKIEREGLLIETKNELSSLLKEFKDHLSNQNW